MSGNAIVIKTSENVAWSSSHFAIAIQSCLEACGHDPNIVQVLVGCEGEAARSLTRSKEISHLTFIGSDKVGKEIAKDAAENLLPVTLELGGKVSSRLQPATRPCERDSSQLPCTGSLHSARIGRYRLLQGCLHEGYLVSDSAATGFCLADIADILSFGAQYRSWPGLYHCRTLHRPSKGIRLLLVYHVSPRCTTATGTRCGSNDQWRKTGGVAEDG